MREKVLGLLRAGAVSFAMLGFASFANAQDANTGIITFTGKIVESGCKIEFGTSGVGGNSVSSQTNPRITLATVAAGAFVTPEVVYAPQNVSLTLSDCTNLNGVGLQFTKSMSDLDTDGYYANTYEPAKSDKDKGHVAAKGVKLAIVDDKGQIQHIKDGYVPDESSPFYAKLTDGQGEIRFGVGYVQPTSSTPVTAGLFESKVAFILLYN